MRELAAYILVSLIAVGGGAMLSLQFLKPVISQEENSGPSQEEVPPPSADRADPSSSESGEEKSAQQGGGASVEGDGEEPAPILDNVQRPVFPVTQADGTADSVREVEVFLEPFIYDARDRRDPFESFQEKQQVESGVPLSALQKFPLESLHLIGIMWDVKNPKAMFTDPSDQVHVVGRDEGIGKRNGYIAAIREGEVVVVEAMRTEKGIEYETKVLRLQR